MLLTINNTLSQTSTWPQYVAGTPWATSLCTIKAGNNGTDLCSLYVNECFDSTVGPGTATDANCPVVSDPSPSSYVTLKDTFDWSGGKVQPQPGTTISLIDFTPASATPNEQWNPSNTSPNPVCTNVSWSTSNGAPTQCDISDTLVDVYGDQTTTRGSKPKSKGWLVSVYNVPMPTTTVQASPNPQNSACPLKNSVVLNNTSGTVWNNGACLLEDFLVSPAQLPAGTTNANGFPGSSSCNLAIRFWGACCATRTHPQRRRVGLQSQPGLLRHSLCPCELGHSPQRHCAFHQPHAFFPGRRWHTHSALVGGRHSRHHREEYSALNRS